MTTNKPPSIPEKYSGEWLRDVISAVIRRYDNPPTDFWKQDYKAWYRHVESINGEYSYDSVLEAYSNLTGTQMRLIESFLDKNDTLMAAQSVARAAYDASLYGSKYLNNLIFLYGKLLPYAYDNYRPISDAHYDIYRVVCGVKQDIPLMPEDQRLSCLATAQFTLASLRSQACARAWVKWVLVEEVRYGHNTKVYLAATELAEYVQQHPETVDKLLGLKRDSPDISNAALLALVDGTVTPSLTSGVL